jgi:hypothetical protein
MPPQDVDIPPSEISNSNTTKTARNAKVFPVLLAGACCSPVHKADVFVLNLLNHHWLFQKKERLLFWHIACSNSWFEAIEISI